MPHAALVTAPITDLITAIEAIPDEVDGLDLKPSKAEARFQADQARASILRLRKLATPLPEA